MKKKPKNVPIKTAKIPKTENKLVDNDIYKKKPNWCFCKMDFEGEWGWGNIKQRDELLKIHQAIKSFESMTWAEIERKRTSKGNPYNHPIDRQRIDKKADERAKVLRIENDTLYSFHIGNLKRIWGYREGTTFYFLWYDPDHTIYPVDP